MPDCEHERMKAGRVTRKVVGKTFSHKGQVCVACGAQCWTEEINDAFNHWLDRIYRKQKDKFSVQLYMAKALVDSVDQVATNHPGTTRSLAIRALTYLYFDTLSPNIEWNHWAEELAESDGAKPLSAGKKSLVKIRLNPHQYLDLEAWSSLTDLPPAKVVEQALIRCVLVYFHEPHETEEIHLVVRSTLKTMLKAAS